MRMSFKNTQLLYKKNFWEVTCMLNRSIVATDLKMLHIGEQGPHEGYQKTCIVEILSSWELPDLLFAQNKILD